MVVPRCVECTPLASITFLTEEGAFDRGGSHSLLAIKGGAFIRNIAVYNFFKSTFQLICPLKKVLLPLLSVKKSKNIIKDTSC